MNCPNCKSPITESSRECEYCGIKITNSSYEKSDFLNKIKFIFKGEWFLVDASTSVFIDNKLKIKGSIKNGFTFEIDNTPIIPEVKLKFLFKSKVLEIPELDVSKNYLIEIEYSRLWGNYCASPKSIKEV
jgi:hypothetical protein